MKIRLTLPQPDSPSFEVDHQIAIALVSLREASITVRGCRPIRTRHSNDIAGKDADTGKALEALCDKGIYGCWEADTQIRTGNSDAHDQGETTFRRIQARDIPAVDQS